MTDGAPHAEGNGAHKLLIVDDEEKICRLMAEHFSRKGYDVRAVHCGEEALALTPAFHPTIVLLDLLMPGLSSVETLKALKHLTPPPKVLIVSAADHEDVVQGMLGVGADFYVCKPVNLTELDDLVNGFCPAKR